MAIFGRTLSTYRASTRRGGSIGGANPSVHARRRALLSGGKVNQAVAVRRAERKRPTSQ